MSIFNIEEIARECCGPFYNEIENFFKQVMESDCPYKVLVTRRSYVLYKIFKKILKCKIRGNVYNTHSLPLLQKNSNSNSSSIIIIDDIIISGNTIEKIVCSLKQDGWDEEHINVWCLRCIIDAPRMHILKKYLSHAIFATRYQVKLFSDMLTDVIMSSNIGFVSCVNSYRLKKNDSVEIYKSMSKTIAKIDHTNFELNTLNSTPTFQGNSSKQVSVEVIWGPNLLDSKIIKQYNILPCIRVYSHGDDSYLTVIPFSFLPSLPLHSAYDYLVSLLGDLSIEIPNGFINSTSDLYDKGFDEKNVVLLYKWTVAKISEKILMDYVDKFSSLKSSDVLLPSLVCDESFLVVDQKCSKRGIDCRQVDDNIQEWNSKGVENSSIQNDDILFCKKLLCEKFADSKGSNRPLENAYLDYLHSIRGIDETNVTLGENKHAGLQISDICDVFKEYPRQQVLNIIIQSWDKGESSYVIELIKDKLDYAYVTGLVRHGEQSYRGHFAAFYEVYPYFYHFFLQTHETDPKELNRFAQYFGNLQHCGRFVSFLNGMNQEDYLTDLMAITPESIEASNSENIKNTVSTYVNYYYKK